MSLLTPFYIAGLLAVAAPLVFHLIRRTPQGEAPFSSLMFLSPSPPRITRRSRLEHLLLLALRGLALALLAAAFARPFLRESAAARSADAARHRVAIVVDASASMRRADLWPRAVAAVDEALATCRPQDEVAVFACDETLRPIAGFDDLGQVEPERRRAVVASRLASVKPTWAGTRLGQALLDAVAALDDARESAEAGRAARRIVLVSDMQSGGRLQAVGDAPWPTDVELELRPVVASPAGNASLERLADAEAEADAPRSRRPGDSLRVRVANAADSTVEQFQLTWMDADGQSQAAPVDAYAPPGESRVVRVARPPAGVAAARLVLTGDAHDFDNALFVAPRQREEIRVAYLGAERADDPEQPRYYLQRALESDAQRTVKFENLPADELPRFDAAGRPDLLVAAAEPTAAQAKSCLQYVEAGGTLTYVVRPGDAGVGLRTLLGVDALTIEEAAIDGYATLGDIDFDYPLFASMAGPKFNDFTKIRFWKYRKLHLPSVDGLHVAARFEGGDPAIIERRLGTGRLIVMAAGWQPSDSQLARSWKFLLMLSSLLDDDRASRALASEVRVGEAVRLPARAYWAADARITRPDGAETPLADGARKFSDATEPGIYTFDMADGPARFAVNIDPTESNCTPLAAEAFEQVGCRLAGKSDAAREAARLQQLRDVELESRQKLWQWLIFAALGVLIVETWLAGRLSRRASAGSAQTPWAPA
jgi:hypothetical protein